VTPPEKVYLIDTNVILRFLLDDHAVFSPKARALMREVSGKIRLAVIPAAVLAECVYVLDKFYHVPRDEITDTLSRTLTIPGIINADKAELLKALLLFRQFGSDIVDCMLAASSSEQAPVVSFDQDLDRLKAFTEKI
jgi:predicted nucleic-acid-binding protein